MSELPALAVCSPEQPTHRQAPAQGRCQLAPMCSVTGGVRETHSP